MPSETPYSIITEGPFHLRYRIRLGDALDAIQGGDRHHLPKREITRIGSGRPTVHIACIQECPANKRLLTDILSPCREAFCGMDGEQASMGRRPAPGLDVFGTHRHQRGPRLGEREGFERVRMLQLGEELRIRVRDPPNSAT